MKLYFNKSFSELIKERNIEEFKNKVEPSLVKLLNKGFLEIDGCIYYCFTAPSGPFSKNFIDRTGNEAFFNKIQIEDYLGTKNDEFDYFIQGIGFSILLYEKLKKSYLCSFKVIFSFDGCFTNVTFHKVRDRENWLSDDLDNFKLESVLVVSS